MLVTAVGWEESEMNFLRRLSGRGDVDDDSMGSKPINMESSMVSKFKDVEAEWFDKSKKDKMWSPWRRRWVTLDLRAKIIYYYDSQEKSDSKSDPSGSMILSDETTVEFVENYNGKQYVFEISGVSEGKGEEILILSAATGEIRDYWHQAIIECTKGILVKQPDILPESFYNVTPLSIFYKDSSGKNSIKAQDGVKLLPEITKKAPTVRYHPRNERDFYTLMLTDPDAPCVAEPIFREFVHWVHVNIPAEKVDLGKPVCPYVGAGPPYNSGTHRYIFLLYLQEEGMLSPTQIQGAVDHFKQRAGLSCSKWVKSLPEIYGEDPVPVGFDGFTSPWSSHVDSMHEDAKFVPPPKYRSPSQVARIEAEERKKEEEIKKKEEEKAMAEKASHEAEEAAMSPRERKFGVGNESVFEGSMLNKKFAHELVYQKRFCWIDFEEKKLFWAKNSSKEKVKSVNLVNDITGINLMRNKLSFTHSMGKKSSIDLEIHGFANDFEEAERWYKIAVTIHYDT